MAEQGSRRRSALRRGRGEVTLDPSPQRVAPAERTHEGSVDSNVDGGRASSDGDAAKAESGVGVAVGVAKEEEAVLKNNDVASNSCQCSNTKKEESGAVVLFTVDTSPAIDDSAPAASLPLPGLAAPAKGDGFAADARRSEDSPAVLSREAAARKGLPREPNSDLTLTASIAPTNVAQLQNCTKGRIPPTSHFIHLQLSGGAMGVNIREAPNGECVVSWSHDASPLRVGDVIVFLNGVKLVYVEGGAEVWAQRFKDPSVSQRNLIVARDPNVGTANAMANADASWGAGGKKGREWTVSEKARFDSGVIMWGWSNWTRIASYITTRTTAQIKSYANNLKGTRKDHFERLKLEHTVYQQRTRMHSSLERNSDPTLIAPSNAMKDDAELQNLIALSAQRSQKFAAPLLAARHEMEHEIYQQHKQMQLDDPEEKWELKAVSTASEILQDFPIRCRCGSVACCTLASNLAPEALQDSCLDCLEEDYGGWPENESPAKESKIPIKYAPVELRDAMTRVCTRLADPVLLLPDLPLGPPMQPKQLPLPRQPKQLPLPRQSTQPKLPKPKQPKQPKPSSFVVNTASDLSRIMASDANLRANSRFVSMYARAVARGFDFANCGHYLISDYPQLFLDKQPTKPKQTKQPTKPKQTKKPKQPPLPRQPKPAKLDTRGVPRRGLFDEAIAAILSKVQLGEDQTSVEERTVAAIYSTNNMPAAQMAQQIKAQITPNATREATQLIKFTSSVSKGKKRVIVVIYIRWSPKTKNDGSAQIVSILIAINYLQTVLGDTYSFELYPITFCGKFVDRRKSHESAGIHQLFAALRSNVPHDGVEVWVFVNDYLRISSEAEQVDKFVNTLEALHHNAMLKSVAEFDLDPKQYALSTQALINRDSAISAVASHCNPGKSVPVAKNMKKNRKLVEERASGIYSQIDAYRPTLTKAAALGNAQPEEILIADAWRRMLRSIKGATAKKQKEVLQREAADFVSQYTYGNQAGLGRRVAFYFRSSHGKEPKMACGLPLDQASISLAFAEDILGGDFAERLIAFHDEQVDRSNICNKQFAKFLAMIIRGELDIAIVPRPERISSELVQIELLDYIGHLKGTQIKYSRCIGQDHLTVARQEDERVVKKKASRGMHNEEERNLRQSIPDEDRRLISDDLKTIYKASSQGQKFLKELFSDN